MTVVVVGKSSFLARSVQTHPSCVDWQFLSHEEALSDRAWMNNASCVINFAFPDIFKTQEYDVEHDIDTHLARMIQDKPSTHYIMLSSRMVYGEAEGGAGFKEGQAEQPVTPYGQAKLAIENSLLSILDIEQLTILRLSNIFGHERNRDTFFGTALTTLSNEQKIFLNLAPDNKRDFLAVWHFVEALIEVVGKREPGIFNLGSGFGANCGQVAEWLIEGYGAGELVIADYSTKGQFWLDMTKTREVFGFKEMNEDILREDCLECGRRLRKQDIEKQSNY
jgi:UDP-glucose 4-epimerase